MTIDRSNEVIFCISDVSCADLEGGGVGGSGPPKKIQTSLNLPSKVTEKSIGPPNLRKKLFFGPPEKFLDPHMRL